jgi:6-phosphofructokinase
LCCAAFQQHRRRRHNCTACALESYRRYGFRGFYDRKAKPVVLTKQAVEGIHMEGGTMLGTSRGGADLRHAPLKPTAHTA